MLASFSTRDSKNAYYATFRHEVRQLHERVPPAACDPVYVLLSSWKREACATVPEDETPVTLAILDMTLLSSTSSFAARKAIAYWCSPETRTQGRTHGRRAHGVSSSGHDGNGPISCSVFFIREDVGVETQPVLAWRVQLQKHAVGWRATSRTFRKAS